MLFIFFRLKKISTASVTRLNDSKAQLNPYKITFCKGKKGSDSTFFPFN